MSAAHRLIVTAVACWMAALFSDDAALAGEPAKAAAAVDRVLDERLCSTAVPSSPRADDAEFLRRATLDIIGRIPSREETIAYLASEDPDKRRHLVDDLLERPSYGEFLATIWRENIAPPDTSSAKQSKDSFTPWLAEQFNGSRGWDEIVSDLLTVEGRIRDTPQAAFVQANSENFDPQANLLADATARLFWGVQLRCAECHNHPFAAWKQTDFWSTAAFFGRLRRGYAEGKNPIGWTFTESPPDEPVSRKAAESQTAPAVSGPAIVVPATGGKLANQTVKARFLGGPEPDWSDEGPFRPRFAQWATGPENPYFAANAVNRTWAHFFGRGLVNPLDEFHEGNPPSHPEVLALVSAELVAASFDLKHLIRVICATRAYQRTSRPLPENEQDVELFSHMAVKLLRPETLYDSLSTVLYPSGGKGGKGKNGFARPQPLPNVTRDEFVRFFGTMAYGQTGSTVNQGIPQFLRLLNGPLLNDGATRLDRLLPADGTPAQSIETLYLAALSRRPTESEMQRMTSYVADHSEPRTAYAGMLWALLSSSEFALNH